MTKRTPLVCQYCGTTKLGEHAMARHQVKDCILRRLAQIRSAKVVAKYGDAYLCDCMTEPDEHGEERVLIHSLTCQYHPDHEADRVLRNS